MLGKNKPSKSISIALVASISVFLGYIACYASIRNAIFPFSSDVASLALRNFYRGTSSKEKSKEDEFFDIAFSGTVSSSHIFHPPAENLESVREFNRLTYFPRRRFTEAFAGISIKSHYLLDYADYPPVSVIRYEVDGYDRKAFVYGKIDSCSPGNYSNESVLFLIPGSGENQSLGAYLGDDKNYHHGIRDIAVKSNLNFLVLIKPNQDFLAYVNKGTGNKLSFDFITSYQYSIGGNYSVSYMVDALAVQKFLKKCYVKTVFAGLSQGGLANFITSLYSNPTVSIVSSGYSLLQDDVYWAGGDQIQLLAGGGNLSKFFSEEFIAGKVKNSSTKFFLTWGIHESGTYGIEAERKYTASRLEQLENFHYDVGDYGHVFPVKAINAFLEKSL